MSHINKSLQWEWFSEELTKRGIRQVYVVIESKNNIGNIFFKDLQKMGMTAYLLPHKNKFSHITNILRTVSLIRKHKPDIVHTSLPFGNLVGQMAAKLTGKKTVTTCENASWAHDFNSKKQEWIDKMTFRDSKKIIANSEISAEYLRKHWNFDKSKLAVIYHGWKPSDYEVSADRIEKLRLQLNMDTQNEFVVGVLARFEFWKGYEFIIEAARILKDNPDIRFYIFGGEGTYSQEARKRIAAYGLQDKIKHTEFIEDSPALCQLFDVHLHVPVDQYVETGGLTIVDGMMAARPQVLTLSGYAYQVSRHMENAYVVPYQDAKAIAEAILWMKNNPERSHQLAQQARADAINMFGINIKVDKHLKIYNELMK
jgi:glycosyltransferase involved in cell wall biosynthesis